MSVFGGYHWVTWLGIHPEFKYLCSNRKTMATNQNTYYGTPLREAYNYIDWDIEEILCDPK